MTQSVPLSESVSDGLISFDGGFFYSLVGPQAAAFRVNLYDHYAASRSIASSHHPRKLLNIIARRKQMNVKHAIVISILATLMGGAPMLAAGTGSTLVVKKADLKWKDTGHGVTAAPVSGDMEKGASRFFLKYPVGLVTPKHHHDSDHYVTVVSGTITLTVEGKEHRLGPGAYFALTNKASHTAKVEGNEDAMFFIQADGPWNVVMEK
jgi:quercetin dioxygenase-like cupin family protein